MLIKFFIVNSFLHQYPEDKQKINSDAAYKPLEWLKELHSYSHGCYT